MRDYFVFLLANRRFLLFGFLMTALSGSGQTYLISLFGAQIRGAFDLGNAGFGALYSGATLISGLGLLWLGRQLDRVDLRLFSVLVLVGAVLGAGLLAGARNAAMLAVAFLFLRLCGQGLMMHTAQTAMARYFDADRGKATGLASLGLPAGEAVFPAVVVAAIAVLGWRGTWVAIGVLLLTLALPVVLWLLRGHGQRRAALQRSTTGSDAAPGLQWRAGEVIRDWRFHGLLSAVLAAPFILTALFFHQVPLAEEKGWTLAWLARSFAAFATGHIGALIFAGPLVDRTGARRLVGFYLAPMALALLVLAGLQQPWVAPLYLGLAGVSMGISGTLMGAIWPELYGTRHLGAIRALVQSSMVLATALAPVLVGLLLDAGMRMAEIALGLLAWVIAASAVAGRAAVSGPPGAVESG